jgi:ammonia channel protein AmtB
VDWNLHAVLKNTSIIAAVATRRLDGRGVVRDYAMARKIKLRWDDALNAWDVHGVGGFWSILLSGVYADKAIDPGGALGRRWRNRDAHSRMGNRQRTIRLAGRLPARRTQSGLAL